MKLNRDAVIGCAIATAYHQRGWCPDTDIEQVIDDFRKIETQAYANLEWMGINNAVIFDHHIAQAIWGLDRSEFEQVKEAVE